jgi:hypothetical protein
MTDAFDHRSQPDRRPAAPRAPLAAGGEAAQDIPELVSALYQEAPATVRTKLLECLLGPVGPLAVVAIATGAFAHLLYRLRLNGTPVSLDDAARISSEHVLQLARFVEQCSPQVLLRIGTLVASSPICVASVSGSALLMALSAWRGRRPHQPVF